MDVPSNSKLGSIKIIERKPFSLPPNSVREVKGMCKIKVPITRDTLLIYVGNAKNVQHEIKLTDGPVIKEIPRPIPAKDFEDARQHIQELLEANIIKSSNSPYASQIAIVRKKSGKLRRCVD